MWLLLLFLWMIVQCFHILNFGISHSSQSKFYGFVTVVWGWSPMPKQSKMVINSQPKLWPNKGSQPTTMAVYSNGRKFENVTNGQLWLPLPPKLAKKHKEVPDFIRQMLKQPTKFHSRVASKGDDGSTCILPPTFVELVSAHTVTRFGWSRSLSLCHACIFM